MSLCYEVVHQQVTVSYNPVAPYAPQEFRVTVPAGKVPLSAGWNFDPPQFQVLYGTYPDGDDWVFQLLGISSGDYDADLYVVCA